MKMQPVNPFTKFPKTRVPLPPKFEKIYAQYYKQNRDGSTTASDLSRRMESWMHRKVAEDVLPNSGRATLEIGAGTLNHLPYESHWEQYDIVEPMAFLYEASNNLTRIRSVFHDIEDIPPQSRYDRIISIAAFEHICNLPDVVSRSALLLAPNGQLRVAIPSEGTILWRLGWQFTTGLEFRIKYNLDYGVLMRHEHVNSAAEIEEILQYYFSQVQGSVFGLSKSLSLYQFFACSSPRLNRC
jgi:trans-aconitate methyltransferase